MLNTDFEVRQSRAVAPLFYSAPAPVYDDKAPKLFQQAGAEYALRRRNCIFGDEPGVGKTLQCILVSNAIDAGSNLVVCPASLRLNWCREIATWSTINGCTIYPILKSRDGVGLFANYVVVSYNLLQNDGIRSAICSRTWDHMIFDEAHKVKDFKGNVTTRIIGGNLSPLAGRISFASGTIMPNQPNECYNAMRILDWDSIDRMSQESFMQRYYTEGEGWITRTRIFNGKRVAKKEWSDRVRNVPINLADLQRRLRSRLMIRRLKSQVLHELPKKQWHLFPLALTPDMRTALKHPGWHGAEALWELDADAFDHGVTVDGEISTARRLLGEAKAPEVARYIEDLLNSGIDKIVVGAWHHEVLRILRERLAKYGVAYMDGATSTRRKQEAVDAFQLQKGVRIILGQKMPLGEGWTLTAAEHVVDAEPDWTPGKNDQLFDRIHRQGAIGDYVTCHSPIVPGTLDEKIVGRSVAKARDIYKALDFEG